MKNDEEEPKATSHSLVDVLDQIEPSDSSSKGPQSTDPESDGQDPKRQDSKRQDASGDGSRSDDPDGDDDHISLGAVLEQFGARAHGPLLLVPGVLATSPIGAIPGMSIAMGLVLVLIGVQFLVNHDSIWLPARIRRFKLPRQLLIRSIEKVRPVARFFDKLTRQRLEPMVGPIGIRVVAVTCVLLGASMIPLAVIPMAVSVPGSAVILFSIAVTTRDGLVASLGYVVTAATGYVLVASFL